MSVFVVNIFCRYVANQKWVTALQIMPIYFEELYFFNHDVCKAYLFPGAAISDLYSKLHKLFLFNKFNYKLFCLQASPLLNNKNYFYTMKIPLSSAKL